MSRRPHDGWFVGTKCFFICLGCVDMFFPDMGWMLYMAGTRTVGRAGPLFSSTEQRDPRRNAGTGTKVELD